MKYRIVGNHRVHGTEPGKTIDLDPDDPQTRVLLRGGHIAAVAKKKRTRKKRSGDAATSEGDD